MNTIHMRLLPLDFGDGINTHLMLEPLVWVSCITEGVHRNVLLKSGNSPDAHFISDEGHGNLEIKR